MTEVGGRNLRRKGDGSFSIEPSIFLTALLFDEFFTN